jgi:uncharacterized protein (DUF427 family)
MKRIPPKKGQESVWDYPRPPALQPVSKHLTVVFAGKTIASSNRAYRILETSHPPVYYMPLEDVDTDVLKPHPSKSTACEFKGRAVYWDLELKDQFSPQAAWSYPSPKKAFAAIKDHVAFYASKVDACYVDGEQVKSQEGDFYGGWITSDIVGPFKGGKGTWGW